MDSHGGRCATHDSDGAAWPDVTNLLAPVNEPMAARTKMHKAIGSCPSIMFL